MKVSNCAESEAEDFKCSCCGDTFPKDECGSCDDICEECDAEEMKHHNA